MLGFKDGMTRLGEFWNELMNRRDPRMMGHPMCSRENWQLFGVPLLLHGDGVACLQCGRVGATSFNVWSFQGLLSVGPTLLIKHYLFGIFKENIAPETMPHVMRVLLCSFEALYLGKWPTNNWDREPFREGTAEAALGGRDLAEGFFGTIFALTGDSKFMSEDLKLRNVSSLEPCEWCPCHRVTGRSAKYHVFNFNLKANWKSTLFTVADWLSVAHNRHEICWNSISSRTSTWKQMNCT